MKEPAQICYEAYAQNVEQKLPGWESLDYKDKEAWRAVAKSNNFSSDGTNDLRREIHSLIRRWGDESDMSVYMVIGVLDAVKIDLWEKLEGE